MRNMKSSRGTWTVVFIGCCAAAIGLSVLFNVLYNDGCFQSWYDRCILLPSLEVAERIPRNDLIQKVAGGHEHLVWTQTNSQK